MKIDRFDVKTRRRMAILTENEFRHALIFSFAEPELWLKHIKEGGDYADYYSFYRLHPEEKGTQ